MIEETACIRCGKTRILKRKWKEKTEKGSIIIREESACPDAECQKLVEEKFEQMREKKRLLTEHREEAKAAQAALVAAAAAKAA